MEHLYKNKYCIGIYELNHDETCVAMFDNVKELAAYINKGEHATYDLVEKHFAKRNQDKPRQINIGRKRYEIAFINMA